MKPNIIRTLLHAWGLFWIILITLWVYGIHNAIAGIIVLCALPINYWYCEVIYKAVFLKDNNKKDPE